jgi:hypothetical protein
MTASPGPRAARRNRAALYWPEQALAGTFDMGPSEVRKAALSKMPADRISPLPEASYACGLAPGPGRAAASAAPNCRRWSVALRISVPALRASRSPKTVQTVPRAAARSSHVLGDPLESITVRRFDAVTSAWTRVRAMRSELGRRPVSLSPLGQTFPCRRPAPENEKPQEDCRPLGDIKLKVSGVVEAISPAVPETVCFAVPGRHRMPGRKILDLKLTASANQSPR